MKFDFCKGPVGKVIRGRVKLLQKSSADRANAAAGSVTPG